ncbi:colicin D domain-containing protein, partial [uncultured Jatrophihabitans sp.]|uniref:colicin D domain-containing protein n=1 Tax=uncultured Jatrophihabitans sp. TaxID=1610747 RepID=UPI0035CA4C03
SGMNCLGRNIVTGAAAGAADGGVTGGLGYATSGQPLTASGFARATGGGALVGGATGGAAGGVLTKVSGSACFVAGTQVLLGDGTSKAIEEIVVGDEVLAADPETGETFAKRVLDTYVHEDVETYVVETSTGSVTSTAEHPFWVDGRGWTPVRELQPGDKLVDAEDVRIELVSVTPTGGTATVYNLNVEHLHNYHVSTGQHWVLVHNECRTTALQLQRKFKHAVDFGVEGNYSPAAASRFDEAIQAHVNSPATQRIEGTYRGSDVVHYVDPNSGLNVITTRQGEFVSGWRLEAIPLEHVLSHGGLGGG